MSTVVELVVEYYSDRRQYPRTAQNLYWSLLTFISDLKWPLTQLPSPLGSGHFKLRGRAFLLGNHSGHTDYLSEAKEPWEMCCMRSAKIKYRLLSMGSSRLTWFRLQLGVDRQNTGSCFALSEIGKWGLQPIEKLFYFLIFTQKYLRLIDGRLRESNKTRWRWKASSPSKMATLKLWYVVILIQPVN